MVTKNSHSKLLESSDEDFYGFLSLLLFSTVFALYGFCILEGLPA